MVLYGLKKMLFIHKMMSRNLRGEMVADLEGAMLSLSDSRFIQVIARSLSIGCKEVSRPDLLILLFWLSLYNEQAYSGPEEVVINSCNPL